MSAYILYQNQTIPEKWGGSLGVSWGNRLEYSDAENLMSRVVEAVARRTTEQSGTAHA